MSKRLTLFLPVIILAAAVILFFNKMALTNLILGRGDTLLYFYPYWQAAADALRAGRVPLWNPDLFMGAPFIANSQAGFFYPLNWPLWLLLPIPYAVSAAILLHLVIAGTGTYLAGRRQLGLEQWPALLAGILFALGGYLTAQVEHVNQLQGLAWLPWFFVVWPKETRSGWQHYLRPAMILGALFALQLLAGHTQSLFISGVGLAVWLVGRFGKSSLKWWLLMIAAGILGILLAAIQLLPTLELTMNSSRQGGLPFNEVVSFSLHPLLAARAFLPAYGQSLFTEYIAFLPLTALLLAFIGGWQWRRSPSVRPFLLLAAIGIFLALGQFNPLYYLLGRLPGFNLFRVPARWLVLYGFGMALLAGCGWQVVQTKWGSEWSKHVRRPLRLGAVLLIGLMLWGFLSLLLSRVIPLGPEAPAEWPNLPTVAGWLLELAAAFLFISLVNRFGKLVRSEAESSIRDLPNRAINLSIGFGLIPPALVIAVLFLASRALPYNNLTTPEAYFDLRPSITRLQAAAPIEGPTPRFLSLSEIFFDPGDLAEIETIYDDSLPTEALYDYIIAIKQKEIIAPNLPLAYGLSSLDGFDGGVLPLESYTEVTTLLLPEGVETTDGRLREHLESVPEAKWLDLFGARFIITDKVGDTWREIEPGRTVYFDLQLPQTLAAGERTAVAHIPDFDPTAIFIIASGAGQVNLTTPGGRPYLMIPELVGDDLWRVGLPVQTAEEIQSIELIALSESWQISGLTLVNETEGTFQSVALGNYRLIHSGDVKIYENLDVLPRAFMVYEWLYRPSVPASVAAMDSADFNPAQQAVIVADGGPERVLGEGEGQVEILFYEPERIELKVTSTDSGLLVMTEANYPGWQAEIDGERVGIEQTDGLFRGVVVPAGEHEVVFAFRPLSYRIGLAVSSITLVLFVAVLVVRRQTGA